MSMRMTKLLGLATSTALIFSLGDYYLDTIENKIGPIQHPPLKDTLYLSKLGTQLINENAQSNEFHLPKELLLLGQKALSCLMRLWYFNSYVLLHEQLKRDYIKFILEGFSQSKHFSLASRSVIERESVLLEDQDMLQEYREIVIQNRKILKDFQEKIYKLRWMSLVMGRPEREAYKLTQDTKAYVDVLFNYHLSVVRHMQDKDMEAHMNEIQHDDYSLKLIFL